jgi:protein-S-isoprenylcysteine O-methyltransferase Ste14
LRAVSHQRRSRVIAVFGSAAFLLIAPGTIAGYLPWTITRWRMQPPLVGFAALRVVGAVLIAIGLVGLLDSFRRFALEGFGTPAPVLPPQMLVVSGLYRFVRNPMYCGIVFAIVGQSLLFGSARLLLYAGVLWLMFHVWIVVYEEPTLRATFGAQYDEFRANVPRWIPRGTPWRVSAGARRR